MKVGRLLKLTPLAEHMEGIVTTANLESGNNIKVKMSLNYKPFEELLSQFEGIKKEFPDFKLFNQELVEGNHIKIPREIINKLQ